MSRFTDTDWHPYDKKDTKTWPQGSNTEVYLVWGTNFNSPRHQFEFACFSKPTTIYPPGGWHKPNEQSNPYLDDQITHWHELPEDPK